MIAFLMVALIGFAAVSIDIAGMWSQRQRLQNGADAAALAIAQDCARNNCGVPAQTATTFATGNFGTSDGSVTATVLTPSLSPATGVVSVRTDSVSHHVFAQILGFSSKSLSAGATANWGAPSGGVAVLPLTFSWCEWKAQTGGGLPSGTTERTINFTKASGTTCTGPSGLVVPGGFGWVDPDAGGCTSKSNISMTLHSSTGASMPSSCSPLNFQAQQNRTVLLPVFDTWVGEGDNASYGVYGYVAFRLTGYKFPSTSWNAPTCGGGGSGCIRGYFLKFVDLDDDFQIDPSAPQLGAQVAGLIG